MKCLILAGGKGERLWPLSRKNFPKQFIQVQRNHSLFQETVARNLPYCDEFIIVTNYSYRSIIANQMEALQGVQYRCVFEEEGRKTTAAIALTCKDLQPSEFVFVVSSDHLIDTGECYGLTYKESILKAKEYAREGGIVLFGSKAEKIDDRFGYFTEDGKSFNEKPDRKQIKELQSEEVFQNLGMLLFQNGTMLNELKTLQPEIYGQCLKAKGVSCNEGMLYKSETLQTIEAISIEHSIVEKTSKRIGLCIGFGWSNIGSLEDLSKTDMVADGVGVVNEGFDTTIINQSSHQAVVVNDLDNVLVVNTTDAVYVGRKGKSHLLKGILHDNEELRSYGEQGSVIYRSWGYRELLVEEKDHRVQRVTVRPGKTIYEHRHQERIENWTIIQGSALITLDGVAKAYDPNDSVTAKAGVLHQISNNGDQDLVFIETAVGEVLISDMHVKEDRTVTEADLGFQVDPLIKLSPAFRDYLWGGTKLRDVYGNNAILIQSRKVGSCRRIPMAIA